MLTDMMQPSGGVRPVQRKSDLQEFLGYDGWALFVLPPDKQNPDDIFTEYRATKGERTIVLDKCFPGERRDWQGMWNYFEQRRDDEELKI